MSEEKDTLTILDLCGGTGSWSHPYLKADYKVINVTLPEYDIRYFNPPPRVYGILAAPPCTEFSSSGARWWKTKPPEKLYRAIQVWKACVKVIESCQSNFWCLENPVGKLIHLMGKPAMYFHPYEYGDPWTKKTALWGEFNPPAKNLVTPDPSKSPWRLPPSENRAALRSITPSGFAQAFFEANR